ncbi:MAG: hypothetical protein IKC46_08045 [Lachnospiraceae bacterium]|nr:hypothetical protein [Lachnospiraceae bacterium]
MKTIFKRCDMGIKYLEIRNSGGKVWLVPFSSVRKGLELYQPSSKKGNILKKYLSVFKFLPFIIEKFGVHIVHIHIDEDFAQSIDDLFDKEDIYYSIFLGTPGRDNKPTIQLYTAKEILGYCKYSANPRICDAFRREAECLKNLHRKGIRAVPEVLLLEEIDDGQTVFIQSTGKRFGASTQHVITQRQILFLLDVSEKTRQKCEFSETDYYKFLCDFKKNHHKFPFAYDKESVEKLIQIIECEMQKVKDYFFYHGDFTPWNTYLTENDTLEAFDFEYAKYTYPKLLDIFHFFTQVKMYENGENAEKIWKDFMELFVRGKLSTLFENVYFSYMLYLVDITNLYIERDYGAFSEETTELLKIRYELMLRCYSAYLEV